MTFQWIYLLYALNIYALIRVIKNPSEWSLFINLIPIQAFLFYARSYGMTPEAWGHAFMLGGMLGALVTALAYFYATIDRIFLGVNIWLLVGAIASVFQIEPILSLYHAYKGPVFFAYVIIIGLISTCCTQAKFIGDTGLSEFKKTQASLALLITAVGAFVWSLITNEYELWISIAAPFISLRIVRGILDK